MAPRTAAVWLARGREIVRFVGLFICPGGAHDGGTSSEHSCGNEGGVMRFAVLRVSVGVAAVVCCSIVGAASVAATPSDTLTAHVIVTGLPDVPPGSVFSGV